MQVIYGNERRSQPRERCLGQLQVKRTGCVLLELSLNPGASTQPSSREAGGGTLGNRSGQTVEALRLRPTTAEPCAGAPLFPYRSSLLGSLHNGSLHPRSPQSSWRKEIAGFRPHQHPQALKTRQEVSPPLPKTRFVQTSLGNQDGWASLVYLNP